MTTIREAAEALNLQTYDTALPQAWVDDFHRITGEHAFGQFVWCYDENTIWGEPYPLSMKALKSLLKYEREKARERYTG